MNQRGKRDRGPYGTAAGLYLTRGWNPLPVRPQDKRIDVDGFTGHDGAYAGKEQVLEWAHDGYAFHNIGIRMPQNIIGIDVDAYGDREGAATMRELEASLGELPKTFVSTARKDGISGIRFFTVPDGRGSWKGKAGAGVDIISWHYRYAVAWPSVHPSTGDQYDWFAEDEENFLACPADIPDTDSLPELPESWRDFLRSDFAGEKSKRLTPPAIKKWLRDHGAGEACEVMADTVEKWRLELEAAGDDGGAHDAMINGVKAIVGDAMAGHSGMWAELVTFRSSFMDAISARRKSDDAATEWRRAVYGAVRLYQGQLQPDDPCTDEYASAAALKSMRPKRASDGKEIDPYEREIARRAKEIRLNQSAAWLVRTEQAAEAPKPVNGADFIELDIPAPRILIRSLLPLDGNSLLVGQRKAGKTTLTHNLTHSLCDEDPFLNAYEISVPSGFKFAIMDFEMQQGMLLDWLKQRAITKNGLKKLEIFSFRGRSSSFGILTSRAQEQWASRLRDSGVQFLILDCLAPAMAANGLDENDNSSMAAFLNAVDAICAMADVSGTLVVHHMGHSGERGRGASRLRDWPETEMHIIVEGQGMDDNGHLRPRAKRYLAGEGRLGAFDEVEMSFLEDEKRLFVSGGSRIEAGKQAAIPEVMAYVQQNPGCSKNAALTGASGAKAAKEAALRELTDDGSICVHVGGRGSHNLWDNSICPEPKAHAERLKMK